MEGEDKKQSKENKLIVYEGLTKESPLIQLPSLSILKPLKSICKIDTSNNISSGFFIKFFKDEKDFFCLMTNEHIITRELVKERKTINVYYDNESKVKEIKLNPDERFIKAFITDINIDATIIEILAKDNIEKDYFLLPCIEYMSIFDNLVNKEITIIQYPLGNISYSNGIIKKINQNEFTHNASTLSGSSGSPVFIKDSIRVIGIHKASKIDDSENYGDFIRPIFNYFKNELKYKIILDNGDYFIGELKNNKKNGKGIIYYNNGNIKYEGDFINDNFGGNGKSTFENGEYYIGEFKNGLKNGKGIYYYNNGNIKYQGDFINDKFDGNGKCIWEDCAYYIGEWKNGLTHGKGKEFYNNGNILYEGNYFNNEREGYGKYIYENGWYYIGNWKNNLKHGKGIIYDKKGNIVYDGEFLKNKYEGKGKYIFDDGEYYIGEFKYGLKNGKGIIYYKNGNNIYEGDFINDKYEGNGKLIYKNGEYYIGEFKNGLKSGKGKEFYNNGNILYEGYYLKNKYEGKGKFIDEDGYYYIGEWKNGLKNGKGIIYDKNSNILLEGNFKNNLIECVIF